MEIDDHLQSNWPIGPAAPQLDEQCVDVWLADIRVSPDELATMRQILSADECDRANRYKRPIDQHKAVVTRATLRSLLSRYLGQSPTSIQFISSDSGKPSVVEHSSGIRFNLSHSGDYCVYAIARDLEVGVDIEQIRPDFDGLPIARRFFAACESDALANASAEDRARLFSQYWTCKEAYVKAIGKGLSYGLADFEVTVGAEPKIFDSTRMEVDGWTLRALEPPTGYVAALVSQTPLKNVRLFSVH